MAIKEVRIINDTLKTPNFLPSSIAEIKGLVEFPKIATKVTITAI